MADPGRVVVVNAGFALWQGGRCVAAARWGDIQRLRAYHRATAGDALHLGVELADGSVMELHEAAPGFDLYVEPRNGADRARPESVVLEGGPEAARP